MGNNSGLIYGKVKDSNGAPMKGVEVSLNWAQRAEGNALTVGGNSDLNVFVPKCTTTKAGEYVIPFFWDSTQVVGSIASALAMNWLDGSDYRAQNMHGQLYATIDVRKLLGNVAPSIPSDTASAGNMLLTFMMAATTELTGMGMLVRFINSSSLISAEQQGCLSRIDFSF